jgi:hypothetical protein
LKCEAAGKARERERETNERGSSRRDMSTNFEVGCAVLVTRNFACTEKAEHHLKGDIGKIVGFNKDGDPEIFFDSWNMTFIFGGTVFNDLKVISGEEASRLRKNSFRVGCAVLVTDNFLHHTTRGAKVYKEHHLKGDIGKIVGFDEDGAPEIFFDSWNKTFSFGRTVFTDLKVISGEEASRLRKNSFHAGCAVLVTDTIIRDKEKHFKGEIGKIVGFDKHGDPKIYFDSCNKTLDLCRVVLKKLKVISAEEASETERAREAGGGGGKSKEKGKGPDRSKDIGRRDPAFDKSVFVRSKDGKRFEFTGEVGFVHGKQKLTPTTPYFEVTINANRADGVGIGLSKDSFFAGSMVGWESESIGFHSNNGHMYYQSRSGLSFGPTSGAHDTIGCGIIFDASDKPQTIFFTRNKRTVGRFPLRSKDYDMLFPAVTSASPAVVTVNLATPPAISMACVLNTFCFEARYNESSKKFKPVSIKGPKNIKGETPVIFNGL